MPTAIIIDDSARDRDLLRGLITHHPDVRIVAECASGAEGLVAIALHRPELVFLDVEMPVMDGLQMLAQLAERDFGVIFITAHSEYAVQAFHLAALHYLLKPVKPDELTEAIGRLYRNGQSASPAYKEQRQGVEVMLHNLRQTVPQKKRLSVNHVGLSQMLTIGEIVYCMSAKAEGQRTKGAYTTLVMADRKTHTASLNLGHFEMTLKDHGFIRIGRQHMVNPDYVKALRSDEVIMRFADGSTKDLSATYGKRAMDALRAQMLR